MIEIAAAVEYDATDSNCQGAFRDRLPDFLSCFDVAAGFYAQRFFSGRGGCYCLRLNVIQAAIDRQPWARSCTAHLAPDAVMNRGSNFCSISVSHFFVNRES